MSNTTQIPIDVLSGRTTNGTRNESLQHMKLRLARAFTQKGAIPCQLGLWTLRRQSLQRSQGNRFRRIMMRRKRPKRGLISIMLCTVLEGKSLCIQMESICDP